MRCLNIWFLAMVLLACPLLCAGTASPGELFPLTDFYDTPESFVATGKPGDLIRSMGFDGYTGPPGCASGGWLAHNCMGARNIRGKPEMCAVFDG